MQAYNPTRTLRYGQKKIYYLYIQAFPKVETFKYIAHIITSINYLLLEYKKTFKTI